ncbi:hypothetical protein ABCR94_35715 [Streptomyces sp. 21So2-11]|uniref:hypothetical protein n=1 Tax=Streptomyces sp. 21So2-11 TaxID=3144408 RepID=UPI00321BAB77
MNKEISERPAAAATPDANDSASAAAKNWVTVIRWLSHQFLSVRLSGRVSDRCAASCTGPGPSVRTAFAKRLIRLWRSDTAIDTTCAPSWARPHTRKRPALEASANWHYKGGGDREFGYSATLAIAAHADPDRAGRYPQLILGMVLHTPEKDMGRHAHYVSAVRAQLTALRGFTAADCAYTKLLPYNFHRPMRALGYMPVLDFTKPQVADQAEHRHQGAITKVGRLFCPLTPRPLLDLYQQVRSARNERERIPLREQLQQIEAYALTRKDTFDDQGTERYACPVTKLNCPWAQKP